MRVKTYVPGQFVIFLSLVPFIKYFERKEAKDRESNLNEPGCFKILTRIFLRKTFERQREYRKYRDVFR